jgi:hypothetical protein
MYECDGRTLSLSTHPLLMSGAQQAAHLIWQRV